MPFDCREFIASAPIPVKDWPGKVVFRGRREAERPNPGEQRVAALEIGAESAGRWQQRWCHIPSKHVRYQSRWWLLLIMFPLKQQRKDDVTRAAGDPYRQEQEDGRQHQHRRVKVRSHGHRHVKY